MHIAKWVIFSSVLWCLLVSLCTVSYVTCLFALVYSASASNLTSWAVKGIAAAMAQQLMIPPPNPPCHHHHHPLPPLIWSILYTDQFSLSGYLIPFIFYILYEAIKCILIRGGGGVFGGGGGSACNPSPGGGGSSYSSFLLYNIICHLYSARLELVILPHCKTWFRYLPSTCSTPPSFIASIPYRPPWAYFSLLSIPMGRPC